MTQQEARLQIAQLVEQRKYEEVLPILEELLEENPSDREFGIYRLLVVRMLIAHWTLSRVDTGELGALWPVTKQVFRRSMIVALRACEIAKRTEALGEYYRTARTIFELPHVKRVVIGGAGFALVIALSTFFAVKGNKVSGQASANAVTAAVSHSANAVVKVTDATVDGARSALLVTPAGAEPLPQVAANAETEFTAAGKAPEAIASNAVAVDGIQSAIKAKADNVTAKPAPRSAALEITGTKERLAGDPSGNKTAQKFLGQFLSERAIPIRKAPRFAAASVRDIDRGMLLNVLEYVGSWARVELSPLGITGFVRKEFLVSVGGHVPTATERSRLLPRTSELAALSGRSALMP